MSQYTQMKNPGKPFLNGKTYNRYMLGFFLKKNDITKLDGILPPLYNDTGIQIGIKTLHI